MEVFVLSNEFFDLFKHDEVVSTEDVISRLSEEYLYVNKELLDDIFNAFKIHHKVFHVWKKRDCIILVFRLGVDYIWFLKLYENEAILDRHKIELKGRASFNY